MGFVSTTAQNHKRLSISFPSLQLFYWYVCASAKHNWNRVCIHFQLFLLVFFLRLDYLNRKSIMMIVRNSFAMINLLSFAQYRVIVEWNWNLIPKCAIDFQHTMSTRNVRILVRGRETKWKIANKKKHHLEHFCHTMSSGFSPSVVRKRMCGIIVAIAT